MTEAVAVDPSTVVVVPPAAQDVANSATTQAAPPPDPNWVNDRIAQAKRSAEADVLKALGVSDVESAKTAIAAANAKAESEKTAEQRAADLTAKLEQEKAVNAQQGAQMAEWAARQMIGLTEEQKTAVLAIAGNDAGKQLSTIAALQPTWAAQAAPATTQAAPAVHAAPNTAPGRTAPADTSPGSPPNNRAMYDEAKKTNPFVAAEIGLRHGGEVYKTRS